MTLTYISRSSDFYTFYVNVPLSLGCIIRKVSAEDIAIRGNGTDLEYMCPTRHFVLIFFNPVFQLSTAKNEINLFNNHILIVAPVTFASAGAMTPSTEFLFKIRINSYSVIKCRECSHSIREVLGSSPSRTFCSSSPPHSPMTFGVDGSMWVRARTVSSKGKSRLFGTCTVPSRLGDKSI